MIATQELNNEEVRVIVHKKNACKVELEVTASPQLVVKARRLGIKAVNKEATFPGFRKGKAPEELVLKKYAGQVAKETHKQLADLAYVEAQKLARVPLLNNNAQISFDLKKEGEEGTVLTFTFETEPEIPLIDVAGFVKQAVERPEVGEKQINEAIRQMAFFYANWKSVEDRAVQVGDYVQIDLDTVDGEKTERVFNSVRFEVNPERMAQWMQKLIVGAKKGETIEGISEPDTDATESEKNEFKPKKVRIKILVVEEASLPEMDDEFAKKVGAQDVAAMRKSITDLLTAQADEKVLDEVRDQINDFLIKNHSFELPSSLIETEKRYRLNQIQQNPKSRSDWSKKSPAERKAAEEEIHQEAEQAVKLFYIARKIVQDEKIPVTHKEVQEEAVQVLRSFGVRDMEKIPKEIYALALSKVILAKAQNLILHKTGQKT